MEINKCPFCWEPAKVEYYNYCSYDGYQVECTNGGCGVTGPEVTDKDSDNPREESIKRWNWMRVVR